MSFNGIGENRVLGKISEFTIPAILTAIRASTITHDMQTAMFCDFATNVYKIDQSFKECKHITSVVVC